MQEGGKCWEGNNKIRATQRYHGSDGSNGCGWLLGCFAFTGNHPQGGVVAVVVVFVLLLIGFRVPSQGKQGVLTKVGERVGQENLFSCDDDNFLCVQK